MSDMPADAPQFWKSKSLQELDAAEWESLCDGCARCCMLKLEDETTGDIHYTSVACRLLDTQTCRCRDYPGRSGKVSDCIRVHPRMGVQFNWLPPSCAYRRLYEGRELAAWHPLVSGAPESVHRHGVSMRGRCISETHVHPSLLEQQLIDLDDFE